MKELVTIKELTEYYKVSRQAVEQWRKQGLPHIKLGTRTFRYNMEEVNQWFKDRASKRANKN